MGWGSGLRVARGLCDGGGGWSGEWGVQRDDGGGGGGGGGMGGAVMLVACSLHTRKSFKVYLRDGSSQTFTCCHTDRSSMLSRPVTVH